MMIFKFSNRSQWQLISVIMTILCVVSLVMTAIAYQTFLLAMLFFGIAIYFMTLIVKLHGKHHENYVVFSDKSIEVGRLLSTGNETVQIDEIKKIIQEGNVLTIYVSLENIVKIHLNYLDSEDIKKLLTYLKYQPSLQKKLLL